MVTRSSIKASMSSRKISLGVPNFLAFSGNLARVRSATRTVRCDALLVDVMAIKFYVLMGVLYHVCSTMQPTGMKIFTSFIRVNFKPFRIERQNMRFTVFANDLVDRD